MNPDTGTFHPIDKHGNIELDLAEQEEARSEAYKRHDARYAGKKQKFPLHPKSADLYAKAMKQKVPEHWPIFSLGEKIEIDGTEFLVKEIHRKDIILKAITDVNLPDSFFIKDYEFRCRKRKFIKPLVGLAEAIFTIRPVKGQPHHYLNR